jgi:Cu/Ag efflux protein CusF
MRKLLEEIKQEKLAPPQDKVDAKRKRVEKAVFLGLSGTTLPTGGEDRGTFGPLKEGQVREFEGAFDVIGRWIKDSNLRREFLDARSKNQSEVKLENEVEEYNDLVNTLFDKKRAKHLRDRGIPSGKQVIGSKKAAETKIRKYLSKEFGVKGVVIKQSGRDIIVEFSERSRTRQENVEAVKRAMNAQARYESAPESGKVVAGRERKLQREAVAAYERISPKIRDLLKKLLYKGKVAKDAIDLSELFITKDSEWNGTSWDNPVVREDANGMEATEMMKELMESAGEDRIKPPREVKEIDVARRKGRFVQDVQGEDRGLTNIESLVKNKPKYDTIRKTLVFLEDEIEDNVKLLDRRKKVEGAGELIKTQLKGVANVVAYSQISRRNQIGRKKYRDMKKIIQELQELKRNFNAELQMPLATTTEEQSQQDRKAQRIARKYDRNSKKIFDDFGQAEDVELTSPGGEQKGKSPFRGSLKQALLSHATKVDFDLDEAIERSEYEIRRTESTLVPLDDSDFKSIIKEFNRLYESLQKMIADPTDYIESFSKDKPEDKPRLRRRKKGTEQSARTIAEEKKKLVAQLREKNPKMSLVQIEDMATQQLQSKMRED